MRAAEIWALGDAHAAEHAYERRLERRARARWSSLAPAERRALLARERRQSRRLVRRTAGAAPAREVGAWTQEPFRLPDFAIHAILLPTGKVLMWGFPPPGEPNTGDAALWDPRLGTGPEAFTAVPPPTLDPDGPQGPLPSVTAPIYCSGQSLLADGTALLTGGNLVFPETKGDAYDNWAGLRTVLTFDPWTETWTRQPDMEAGRWYPTQTELGDGRTLIMGGYTDEAPGAIRTDDVEVFTPGAEAGSTGSLALLDEPRITELYPHVFLLPNNRALVAGPGSGDSAILNPRGFRWSDLPNSHQYRYGGTAVLAPASPRGSWRARQIGGYGVDEPLEDGTLPATASSIGVNVRGDRRWHPAPTLRLPRSYQNTVLLPDGSMATVGGGIGWTPEDGNFAVDPDGAQRRVELFNPQRGRWRLGPAQYEDRGYHSTALLLPDGRVFSGGDNAHPLTDGVESQYDTAEIYSPPYLFQGPRPRIKAAPARLRYGSRFAIATGHAPADRAVLVAPGAPTHGNDMHQRLVRLRVRRHDRHEVRLFAPPRPGVAPPGYYMLFALTPDGVPSVARWVRLEPRG